MYVRCALAKKNLKIAIFFFLWTRQVIQISKLSKYTFYKYPPHAEQMCTMLFRMCVYESVGQELVTDKYRAVSENIL